MLRSVLSAGEDGSIHLFDMETHALGLIRAMSSIERYLLSLGSMVTGVRTGMQSRA
jgi:hypothetical protein